MSSVLRPRVIIADDHSILAAGIARLLEHDCELIGTVRDGLSLIATVKTTHPDVVLTAISLPALNGLEATRQIRATLPSCKVVFVTMHSDSGYVREAFRAGGSAYVLKRSAPEELATAVREVLRNKLYLTPLINKTVLDGVFSDGASKPVLTVRQRQVLQLVAEGHTAKEIGSILGISSKTAEFHKGAIMKTLNLSSTAQLTRYALLNRIVAGK